MMAWTLHTELATFLYMRKKLEIYDYDFMRMRVTGELSIMFYFCRTRGLRLIEKTNKL